MSVKLFRCETCGQLVALIKDTGATLVCCNKPMVLIKPNTVDASEEKHVPTYKRKGDKVCVQVGSSLHPSSEGHYIEWIAIETDKGWQKRVLTPNDEAKATFYVSDNELLYTIYAYCNLHGLWKLDVNH